jgi:hypothetical protein
MTVESDFNFNLEKYESLLKAVASMSGLYSDNTKALIHPRFVEKLYVYCSGAADLSRRDMSYDALLGADIGVGVKTFVSENVAIGKSEKVAEFTKNASLGDFQGLDHYGLAKKSSELRNSRITSDANEYAIDIDKSIYHCLVRTDGYALIHEEPYQLVNLNNIIPTDSRGFEISQFSNDGSGHSYFGDGISKYRYDVAKNVLYKKFELGAYTNSPPIPLFIYADIFEKILLWTNLEQQTPVIELVQTIQEPVSLPPHGDFVVLPLYGTQNRSVRIVPQKSGINQWNAGGRARQFGEAYISIPAEIHRKYPGFFPRRDVKFRVKLPNGAIIDAKVCQDNSKALMSDPNTSLCDWLFNVIDKSRTVSMSRFYDARPYTYDDLKAVGKDSVKVIKLKHPTDYEYEMETMDLTSYETFVEDGNNNDDLMEDVVI